SPRGRTRLPACDGSGHCGAAASVSCPPGGTSPPDSVPAPVLPAVPSSRSRAATTSDPLRTRTGPPGPRPKGQGYREGRTRRAQNHTKSRTGTTRRGPSRCPGPVTLSDRTPRPDVPHPDRTPETDPVHPDQTPETDPVHPDQTPETTAPPGGVPRPGTRESCDGLLV